MGKSLPGAEAPDLGKSLPGAEAPGYLDTEFRSMPMNDETYDDLRRAVIQILGPRPSAARRQQIAADLRAIAEQQERMALREGGSPMQQPAPPAPPASAIVPGMYIRIAYDPDPLSGKRRVRLSIGKQAWFELGSPERIDVQSVGDQIWLVSSLNATIGYELQMGGSIPSCIVADKAPVARLQPGRYSAAKRAGAIVVGEKVAK